MAYVLAGVLMAVDRGARVVTVGATQLRLVDGLIFAIPVGSSVTVTVEERGGVLWATSITTSPGVIFGAVKKPPTAAGEPAERQPGASGEGRQAAP